MGRSVHIWNVDEETHLKMRLLCAGRGISMGKLLSDMIGKEWQIDKTAVGKLEKRRIRKIVKRWR